MKLICPVMSAGIDGALETLALVRRSYADAVEYRADWRADVRDASRLLDDLRRIREALGDMPLLFTFRTAEEGGNMRLDAGEYARLVRLAIDSGCIDMIDIEGRAGDTCAGELIAHAHAADVIAVYSCHDFARMPEEQWICDFIAHGRRLGADIPKCAALARGSGDMLTMLSAAERMTRGADDGPVLTIAMGADGVLSRLAGEFVGSCLTFCSLNGASAPGQLDCERAYDIVCRLHDCRAL